MMQLYLAGVMAIVLGGLIALPLRNGRLSFAAACAGMLTGTVLTAIPAVRALWGVFPLSADYHWFLPGAAFSYRLDSLSAFFCLPVLLISPLALIYGRAYLRSPGRRPGAHWFFYNLLAASMLLLLAANSALLFLIVWEVMALASFFLVMHDHRDAEVRKAGWTYLIATHVGTVALLAFFAILGGSAGSLDFGRIAATQYGGKSVALLFWLALFGFGVKAGFIPLHIWLPEAHPAAPSHVSALMSGVMIKTGIYGLLRALLLLGQPSAWMGWVLVIVGIVSGVGGVLFALAQHDLKRLLAYHSVENIGIIALGLGTGVLGLAWQIPALAILGFGGGLLHVLNHAIFKSLLFMGAGSVIHSCGTSNIELLGGVIKRARWTGITFLIGSAAISALPPFNGFISEFYIYFAGVRGLGAATPGPVILAVCLLASLALIGGLALACFAKAFGIVFLGEPRSDLAHKAHDPGWMMRLPMLLLSLLCLLIGLLAPLTLYLVFPPVIAMAGLPAIFDSTPFQLTQSLSIIAFLLALLLGGAAWFHLIRRSLPRGRQESRAGTWDCGYLKPSARMQYTASSFAAPITGMFQRLLCIRKRGKPVEGYFPASASFHSDTPDAAKEGLFAPLFRLAERLIAPLRKLQHGNLNGYLLYIAVTLIALLVWKTVVAR